MQKIRLMVIALLFLSKITIIVAQKKQPQSFEFDNADSLHFCGYFEEEVIERIKHNNANPLLLENARICVLESSGETEKATKALAELEKKYENKTKSDKEVFYLKLTQARILRRQEKYEEAIKLLKEIAELQNPLFDGLKSYELAYCYSENLQPLETIKFYKKAIQLFEKHGLKNHYITAEAYNNLAYAYDEAHLAQEVIKYSEIALSIWTKFYADDVSILSTAYNNAIFYYIDYGDRWKAKKYQVIFEKLIASFLQKNAKKTTKTKSKDDYWHSLLMFHLSSVRFYGFFENLPKVEEHINAMENLFSRCPKSFYDDQFHVLVAAYDAAAYSARSMGAFETATEYNRLAEKNALSDFHRMKAQATNAMINYGMRNHEKSLEFTEKSLNAMQYSGKGTSYFTVTVLKAELLANLNRPTEAIGTLKELYKLMLKKDKSFSAITANDFAEVSSKNYIDIFIHSGLTYRKIYESTGKQPSDLKTMKHFYKLAAAMFERYYQKGIFNPSLDKYLGNIKEGLLYADTQLPAEQAEIIYTLNTLENISSQHLWKQFVLRNEENLNLPKALLERKNEVQLRINLIENLDEFVAKEELELELLKKQLAEIENEIYKQNPKYQHASVYDFDVKLLQKRLNSDREIFKYSVTDSCVYVHIITKNTIRVKALGKKQQIEKIVKVYYQQLTSIGFDYRKTAKQLGKILLQPITSGKSTIDIITENFLSYLPFETLENANGQPLLENATIAYTYSLKFWEITSTSNEKYTYSLIGFAPQYLAPTQPLIERDMGNLIYTTKELNKIVEKINNSYLYIAQEATKSNFLKSIGQSKIHHLAMHSLLDETDYERSSLLFQNNEKLYFSELYSLNFPSEMVVLSACNTGVGQYQNGEGLMSISRALNYAGVKSLIHSLWEVPDKETAELMDYFYTFLSDGKAKGEALAMAKRKFIEKNPSKTHPYYWAGFVLNGNAEPIEKSIPLGWWIGGGVVVFIMLIIFNVGRVRW